MGGAASASTSGDWSIQTLEYLYLEGVSWELYEHLLKVAADRPLRLTYDQGELEIMSPLPEDEIAKAAMGKLIDVLLDVLGMPYQDFGSTTFRQRAKKKGLEPDTCFYIQNRSAIAGKKRINLAKDPAPDLAVEIDITSRSIERLPIYAALGVPEVWRYDGKEVFCLILDEGKYLRSEFGLAFPKLRVSELSSFVRIAEDKGDQRAAIKAFRAWLNKQAWAR